jgi:pimeloyl-ACP methyl ester carboxylesterase
MKNLPVVLIPGLNCSARLYVEQIPHLWRLGPVMVADHTRGGSVAEIAEQILASAPAHFALAAFSFGGYVAFEILRQAAQRVARLALLDTSARADTTEQIQRRMDRMAMAETGHFHESLDLQFPLVVHPSRQGDVALQAAYRNMAEEYGSAAFVSHCKASISRPDSRRDLASIRCPTIVVVGDSDQITPPALAKEMADGIIAARLIVIPQSGHLSPLERPEIVTQALVEMLSAK